MNRYRFLLLCVLFVSLQSAADQDYFITLLQKQVTLSPAIKASLSAGTQSKTMAHSDVVFNNADLALYEKFPHLSNSLPHVVLGNFPTPVAHLSRFSALYAQGAHVFIKRDDLTGCVNEREVHFGGNKIRKLEFLLADALQHGAQTVMTYGCIGSNHATATASCAQRCGLRCINLLKPQPLSSVVKRNLLLMHEYGAQMILNPNKEVRSLQTICSFFQNKYAHGDLPYLIPTGGSNEIGAIGYVNAAFELYHQIERGEIGMPDYIYIPVGSCGTASGFLVGARAAGITARIKLIAVENNDTFAEQIITLCGLVVERLRACDDSFPQIAITSNDFDLTLNFAGERYGKATDEGNRAAQFLQQTEDIVLDGTYSAKAFSGMLYDLEHHDMRDKKVLFWHTFCNYIEPQEDNFNNLAPAFHQFFN
jgi:1-aminocyclopropane-1-carboxylate deaminase/D-cysteine desulfhydrase-like pyridoxal-dependent ACC family enzyme